MSVRSNLEDLADRWAEADAGERSNFQLYLTELCDALDVARPQPKGSGYEFEFPVKVVEADGTETTKPADLFRKDHFLLEAKDIEPGKSDESLLRRAYGQARGYVTHLPGDPPPYLLVMDVGRELLIWDRWNGTYGGFAAAENVDLRSLHERPDDIAFVQDIWTQPEKRDPRARSNAVTRQIAQHLAELASSLEERGHSHEEVARFLIRCVFTMFAEDIGLLEGEPFLEAVSDIGLEEPEEFAPAIERLWVAMDEGKEFGLRRILRFNGHFFQDRTALPLDREDLVVLLEAAEADWRWVEPSIFGTLFTRALDPEERHRLGAQFTPREYVERLVRPTIEEPVRERWRAVEASVFQLRERGRKQDLKEATKQLREFHNWLRSLTVLDPACGSGNFLYVSLATLKRIEGEVLQTLEDLTGEPDMILEEIDPSQFHGIEVEPWAREIAELTLWIGYHQFWQEHHGHVRPPEPVLRDTGTLECRDAVLEWDERVERPEKARPDSTPRVEHPVTGKLVPDPDATVAYWEHMNPRQAEWPEADFIIGNPPYMGRARQREEFGDGYVDALWEVYDDVPRTADYVMYWWYRAARKVASGETIRAGLITTNSITQSHQRQIIEDAANEGAHLVWAVPDHPWVDEEGSAQVRVAMTVLERKPSRAKVVEVDDAGEIVQEHRTVEVNSDLSAHASVTRAADEPLLANEGLSSNGFNVVGRGFVLEEEEAKKLLNEDPDRAEIIRPYRNGRDLTQYSRGVYIIDFGTRSEEEAREWPALFDVVRDRVKPERDTNNDPIARKIWWRFARNREAFRQAVADLDRYIATPYVSKHQFFTFLDAEVAPDDKLRVIASHAAFHLGVLSSRIHVLWALAAGGRLGVGNDPVYNQTLCFQPFPFPACSSELEAKIGAVAEKIDDHREAATGREKGVTVTRMYNIIEKLRSGEKLSDREREIHQSSGCGVLRDLHDELDGLVAEAYSWDWPLTDQEILEQLVELHDERRKEEEEDGTVRWLRPAYQVPRFAPEELEAPELELEDEKAEEAPPQWPEDDAVGQISAIKANLSEAPGTIADISDRFQGAQQNLVEHHLETLVLLGEARKTDDGRYHPVEEPAVL